ncbi:hypothetical protein MTYP_00998 [Methylophilaceae bacterium]|nr:hypothetical protein MTYP_00998 [Methylophilaceae bacterium]
MSVKDEYPVLDWLLKLPLYEKIDIGSENQKVAESILLFEKTFDAYCPFCRLDSTFKTHVPEDVMKKYKQYSALMPLSNPGDVSKNFSIWDTRNIQKSAQCTRDPHELRYFFTIDDSSLIKIGQHPPLAEHALAETTELSQALSRTQLNELNTAIKLASHGVGVGSYVYLRRVFESLINQAHQTASLNQGWNEGQYNALSMKDRIQLLSPHLPEFVVQTPQLYGLFGKALHELTDDECLANFDVLKNGIFAIAEERLIQLSRLKRMDEVKKAIAKLGR